MDTKLKLLFGFFFMTMLIVIMSNLVSAEIPDLGYKPQGKNIELLQTCNNGTTICTECNISSVKYANTTALISSIPMTKRTYDFNYTLNATYTSTVGDYTVNGICTDGTIIREWNYYYHINPSGVDPSDARTSSISRSVYFLFGIAILLFIAFLFFGASMPVRLSFLGGSVIFMLIAINIVFVALGDEVVNPKLTSLFSSLTAISFYLYWFIAGIILIMWLFTFLQTYLYKRNMDHFRKFGGNING